MTKPTEFEALTEKAHNLTPEERADRIAYWYDWHEADPGEHENLLTDDLFCECCGVDYSGFDRDLLNEDGSVPSTYEKTRRLWVRISQTLLYKLAARKGQ